jgi:hypothetical protein
VETGPRGVRAKSAVSGTRRDGRAAVLFLGVVSACFHHGAVPRNETAERCLRIVLEGWYGPPTTRESGPCGERPDHYHGIPQIVRVLYAVGDPVRVTTSAPEHVAAESHAPVSRLSRPPHGGDA